MKKAFFAVLMLILFVPAAYSQPKDSLISKSPKFSLMFQLESGFKLSPFSGFDIAGKYIFNDKFSARLGIGYNLMYKTGNFGSNFSELSEWNNSIRINAALIYNFFNKHNFIFYAGGGPLTIIGLTDNEGTYRYEKYNSFSAGIFTVAGAEWFPVKYIGLSGEAGISAYYSSLTQKYYSFSSRRLYNVETHSISVSGNNYKLGLSLYF